MSRPPSLFFFLLINWLEWDSACLVYRGLFSYNQTVGSMWGRTSASQSWFLGIRWYTQLSRCECRSPLGAVTRDHAQSSPVTASQWVRGPQQSPDVPSGPRCPPPPSCFSRWRYLLLLFRVCTSSIPPERCQDKQFSSVCWEQLNTVKDLDWGVSDAGCLGLLSRNKDMLLP